MSARMQYHFQLWCDACHCPGPSALTMAELYREARVLGWVNPEKQLWICPNHECQEQGLVAPDLVIQFPN